MISKSIVVDNTTQEEFNNQVTTILHQNAYRYDVGSSTDISLILYIEQGNMKTKVSLERNPHKPSLLTIKADALHYEYVGKYNKHQKNTSNRNNSGRGGFYRYYFYFIIFGAVATGLYYLFDLLFPQDEQKLGFFITLLAGVILFFTLKPRYDIVRKNQLHAFDQRLINLLSHSLTSKVENRLQKCWNCFQEVNFIDKFCPNCGK